MHVLGPILIASKQVREEVREYLSLAESMRDFLRSLGFEMFHGRYENAREILEDRIREQKAGPARHLASKLAGARK